MVRLQLSNHEVDLASLQRQYTSAPSSTTRALVEFIDDEDTDPDGTDYDDEVKDDEYDDEAPLGPLAFLCTQPFPDLSLSVYGFLVAIVDTDAYVKETNKTNLTTAMATATILWNWHPNAVRAFLDH